MKKIAKLTRMKKLRITLKLTQAEMASKVGVAISSIGGYERGENPLDKPMVDKISEILGKDVKDLFVPHKKLKDKFLAI